MNIGAFLSDAAMAEPERPAFVFGDRTTTYAATEARAAALATGLLNLGLVPGDRVGVLMANCPQMLETMFAVWKAGSCIVPLNARFVADEVAYHLQDSGARALVFGPEFRDVVAEVRPRVGGVAHFVVAGPAGRDEHDLETLIAEHADRPTAHLDVGDGDLAWLFYTSGTTGRPKGAMLTHGNLAFASVGWCADLVPLRTEDVGLHAAPLSHGAGFHALALTMKASTQVISDSPRFEGGDFLDTVTRHRVTNTWLVPTQIKRILQEPDLECRDLSSLRWIVYGGAPAYAADLAEAVERLGPILVQLYGQGETPMTATYLRPEAHRTQGPWRKRLESCGRPRSGTEIRILDAEGAAVPSGEQGEICVRGPSVMAGYWGRPEATRETLRGGWLHTGDLGYMDDRGYVFILDRSKDMIISGGANVYPREVEEVLLRHPEIADACVFGLPDESWGERVVACLVTTAPLASADVAEHLEQRIAGYKKPKAVHFLPEIPRNAYGKALKRELRDRFMRDDIDTERGSVG